MEKEIDIENKTDGSDCQKRLVLPAVAGRMECSNAEFERRCLICLAEEQDNLMPDNALIAVLCDGVRLARKYSTAMNGQNKQF